MRSAPVAYRQTIAAPPNEVWALISAPGQLTEFHPFCAANPVQAWPGTHSVDVIEYHSGRIVTRSFTAWDEGAGYDLEVSDAGGAVAGVSWRLSGQATGSSLTIGITPRMLGDLPAALRWAPNRALVHPMLRRYLKAVLRGIEWRVTTGRQVRPDQFGTHRWFSARPAPGADAR